MFGHSQALASGPSLSVTSGTPEALLAVVEVVDVDEDETSVVGSDSRILASTLELIDNGESSLTVVATDTGVSVAEEDAVDDGPAGPDVITVKSSLPILAYPDTTATVRTNSIR